MLAYSFPGKLTWPGSWFAGQGACGASALLRPCPYARYSAAAALDFFLGGRCSCCFGFCLGCCLVDLTCCCCLPLPFCRRCCFSCPFLVPRLLPLPPLPPFWRSAFGSVLMPPAAGAAGRLRCRRSFLSSSIQAGTSQPAARMTLAMLRSWPASSSVKKVTASPAVTAVTAAGAGDGTKYQVAGRWYALPWPGLVFRCPGGDYRMGTPVRGQGQAGVSAGTVPQGGQQAAQQAAHPSGPRGRCAPRGGCSRWLSWGSRS